MSRTRARELQPLQAATTTQPPARGQCLPLIPRPKPLKASLTPQRPARIIGWIGRAARALMLGC